MILEKNFVSISDLRDKTAKIIKDINIVWKKIVLSQNKPIWVILSIDEYNSMQKLNFEKEKATPEDIKAFQQSSHWDEWVEAFSFLQSLK